MCDAARGWTTHTVPPGPLAWQPSRVLSTRSMLLSSTYAQPPDTRTSHSLSSSHFSAAMEHPLTWTRRVFLRASAGRDRRRKGGVKHRGLWGGAGRLSGEGSLRAQRPSREPAASTRFRRHARPSGRLQYNRGCQACHSSRCGLTNSRREDLHCTVAIRSRDVWQGRSVQGRSVGYGAGLRGAVTRAPSGVFQRN